jgi:hypothetical protein
MGLFEQFPTDVWSKMLIDSPSKCSMRLSLVFGPSTEQILTSFLSSTRHHLSQTPLRSDSLIFCRKQPGVAIGRLCEKCDGKCVICDSYVRPSTLVHICDECNYGSYQGRCVICGGMGISDAYYCTECTVQEKDVSSEVEWC